MPRLTWLNTIPAIPLDRGVPVWEFYTNGEQRRRSIVDHIHPSTAGRTVHLVDGSVVALEWLCVDLNDAQGMGYALRWYRYRHPQHGPSWKSLSGVVARHFNGQTTDADRVDVARALRAVVGSV